MMADLAAKRTGGRRSAASSRTGRAGGRSSSRRDPGVRRLAADVDGPRHLDEEFALVRATFHRFAEEQVRPHAEHVHRTNGDIPEEVIAGLAELGGFGLSVPEEYGGFATAASTTTWAWSSRPRS